MKILAFSDLHLDRDVAQKLVHASDQADVVVGAGDFAVRQRGLSQVMAVLEQIKKPTVLVPGNHDDLNELKAVCATWSSVHILHGNGTRIGGQEFFGLGYEAPRSSFESWNRFLTEAEAARMLAPCVNGSILVTHAPPYGVADEQANGTHEGSTAIRAAIEERRPRLHLCGHIHHSWGRSGQIGSCSVYNLGPTENWF